MIRCQAIILLSVRYSCPFPRLVFILKVKRRPFVLQDELNTQYAVSMGDQCLLIWCIHCCLNKENENTTKKHDAPYGQNSYRVVEIEEIFMQLTHINIPWSLSWYGLWCLTPLLILCQLCRGAQYYWWRKSEKSTNLSKVTDKRLSHHVTLLVKHFNSHWRI